jgi:hypothetical protein
LPNITETVYSPCWTASPYRSGVGWTVQLHLSRRERSQAPGSLGRPVVEHVLVVEVQFK